MQSTFSGIELGKRGLVAHTQGLQTVGHNLSNASTEGYSRQRVEFKPTDALYVPGLNREERPGQIGQGTDVARIERIRDVLLDHSIVGQAHLQGYWGARDKYVGMMEDVYNEVADTSLRSSLDQFWDSWQELALHPAEMASRAVVLERANTFVDGIHERFKGLTRVRDQIEEDIKVTVGEINTLSKDIAALNGEILRVKAQGDMPNDLMDRRDLLVEKLSGLLNITVDERDPDEFLVHTSGFHLVQGEEYRPLSYEGEPANDGYIRVFWRIGEEDVRPRGGKLAGLLELRDNDVRKEIQNLDNMTVNFMDLVNEIHSKAWGLNQRQGNPFFVEYPAVLNLTGNYDRNGDGEYDSSYVFRITGSHKLDPQEHIGLAGEMVFDGPRGQVRVPYYPADTVEDVVGRINHSGADIAARLDREGRLSLKGVPAEDRENPDFVIRHVEDSGQFLAGYAGVLLASGPEGAYSWDRSDAVYALEGGDSRYTVAPLAHPSAWVHVNEQLQREPASIAASFGEAGRPGFPGDGEAALAIADLRFRPVMLGKTTTLDNFFANTVAVIGLKGEQADIELKTQDAIMKDLRDKREALSGVNIDEEIANLIKYQHGYAAVAHFITEFTKMIDTIINRLGV
ncbi:MAG: flagellar hook-associated protein FlgK [Spirochaetales bacterium]|jgi:flagellar hook-associated protein 1 FlgK|nr:flagellar hook-associated protein FlgK [Spirochaetales bacterium]